MNEVDKINCKACTQNIEQILLNFKMEILKRKGNTFELLMMKKD